MARFIHLPITVDAVRFLGIDDTPAEDGTWIVHFDDLEGDGDNGVEPQWMAEARAKPHTEPGAVFVRKSKMDGSVQLRVQTLEGSLRASPGDYIVCGTQGEKWPIKPDIFADTYAPVESQ